MAASVFEQRGTQPGRVRAGEIDMDNSLFLPSEERAFVVMDVVDKVVRHHRRIVFELAADAGNGRYGGDTFRTYGMQRPDIDVVADFVWDDDMAGAVPYERDDVKPAQPTEQGGIAGQAVGRVYDVAVGSGEFGQSDKATATDNG